MQEAFKKKTKCFWKTVLFLNLFIFLEALTLIAGIVFTWRTETVFSQLKLIFCLYAFIFFSNSIIGLFGIKNHHSCVVVFAVTLTICRVFFLVVTFFILYCGAATQEFVDSTFPDSHSYMQYILDIIEGFGDWPKIGYAVYSGITVVYLPIILCYTSRLKKRNKIDQITNRIVLINEPINRGNSVADSNAQRNNSAVVDSYAPPSV